MKHVYFSGEKEVYRLPIAGVTSSSGKIVWRGLTPQQGRTVTVTIPSDADTVVVFHSFAHCCRVYDVIGAGSSWAEPAILRQKAVIEDPAEVDKYLTGEVAEMAREWLYGGEMYERFVHSSFRENFWTEG